MGFFDLFKRGGTTTTNTEDFTSYDKVLDMARKASRRREDRHHYIVMYHQDGTFDANSLQLSERRYSYRPFKTLEQALKMQGLRAIFLNGKRMDKRN